MKRNMGNERESWEAQGWIGFTFMMEVESTGPKYMRQTKSVT